MELFWFFAFVGAVGVIVALWGALREDLRTLGIGAMVALAGVATAIAVVIVEVRDSLA